MLQQQGDLKQPVDKQQKKASEDDKAASAAAAAAAAALTLASRTQLFRGPEFGSPEFWTRVLPPRFKLYVSQL